MLVNDPIADMLTRIRNASLVSKENLLVPDSKMKRAVLEVIKQKGYIADFSDSAENPGYIKISLAFLGKKSIIQKIERVSKPGCRMYVKKDQIPHVLSGMGIVIISTSSGVMTGSEARSKGLGGEVICKIY